MILFFDIVRYKLLFTVYVIGNKNDCLQEKHVDLVELSLC